MAYTMMPGANRIVVIMIPTSPAAHTRNTVYTKPTVPNTRAFFTCSGVRCSRFQAIFM